MASYLVESTGLINRHRLVQIQRHLRTVLYLSGSLGKMARYSAVRFLCGLLESTAMFLRDISKESQRKRKHRLTQAAVAEGVRQGGHRVYNTQGFDQVN